MSRWLRMIFYRRSLTRKRLEAVIIATCPTSYWSSFDGDVEALKRRLSR